MTLLSKSLFNTKNVPYFEDFAKYGSIIFNKQNGGIYVKETNGF